MDARDRCLDTRSAKTVGDTVYFRSPIKWKARLGSTSYGNPKELRVYQHNMANSSPVVWTDFSGFLHAVDAQTANAMAFFVPGSRAPRGSRRGITRGGSGRSGRPGLLYFDGASARRKAAIS